MTRDFRDRPEFKQGRAGELVCSGWLQEHGWYVIPSYDYSGDDRDKAPRLRGLVDGFPVPDLDVARGGVRRWVEVKTKTTASWTWKWQRYEHGIEHYDDYMRVAAETGTEAWLAIFETSTRELLGQSFVTLGEPRRSRMNGRQMAFWPRDDFKLWHTFSPETP